MSDLKQYIAEMPEEDLKNLQRIIDSELFKKKIEKTENIIRAHEEYLGKCYTRDVTYNNQTIKKYYKIISAHGVNEHHMIALSFPEKPMYAYSYDRVNFLFGKCAFFGFDTEDIGFFCFDHLDGSCGHTLKDGFEEISAETYEEAMYRFTQLLAKESFSSLNRSLYES
jgi:hypothetical protein